MSKKIFILVAAVAFLGLTIRPAAAEIKNLKVGGDIVIRGIYRDNLDFIKADVEPYFKDTSSWIMQTARVYVSAELTDNVFGLIRVINERDWGTSSGIYRFEDELGAAAFYQRDKDINLDLAYIKAVDLLTPGLTLTLGRQEILLGKGFVMGNSHYAPTEDTIFLAAPDLTAIKAFDAVRADYEVGAAPVTLTAFATKIRESFGGVMGSGFKGYLHYGSHYYGDHDLWVDYIGDIDLRGLNASYYAFDNATIETYILTLHAKCNDPSPGKSLDVWTFGVRGDHEVLSVPGLAYSAEMAWQFGDVPSDSLMFGSAEKDAKGYAGTLDVNYAFANPYEPKIGLAYTLYSGDKDSSDSDYKAWIPLYPDNLGDTIGALTYASSLKTGMPLTNLSIPKVYGSFKPAEKHTVSLSVFPATKTAKKDPSYGKKDIGYEIDLGYTYQYTEDLSFGLLFGYAKADDLIKEAVGEDDFDSKAMQVIGTVALAF